MTTTRPLLLAAALLLGACNVNVDPQFRVKDVRILAVRSRVLAPAPQPFPSADVAPGETLTLDALVANPLGRPGLAVDWFACLPATTDAVSPCADLATLRDPNRLRTLPGVLALGSGASVQVPVPDLAAALSFVLDKVNGQPTYACRMYAEIVVVVIAAAEGRQSVAVKTVRVVPPPAQAPPDDLYVLNLNPAVEDVVRAPSDVDGCTGGSSLSAAPFPAGRTTLCGRAVSGSIQRYAVCDPGRMPRPGEPNTDESLGWQWYVTDGDFPGEGGVGNATGAHVDFTRPPGAFTLWVILRDGRGGDDWVTLLVSAP